MTMWHNNKTVVRTYTSNDGQNAWAIISTISGWKKIKTGAADGVTNVFVILCAAKANNRQVSVYLNNDLIERAQMV